MLSLINLFRTDERGVTTLEYAVLVVFIALVVAVGAQTFGNGLKTWFTNTGTNISALNSAIP